MRVEESVRRSVGFIGRWEGGDSGKFIPHGTAFVATCASGGHLFTNLVTAQHVIASVQSHTDRIVWRFNSKSGEQAFGELPYHGWHFHPDATRFVDVAVAPISLPEIADFSHVNLDSGSATERVIRSENIGPGEAVFVAGFFRYHWGKQKNIPIIRVGNIAAMPEEPIETRSGPINAYLIESRSIGGLSGSPVFVHMAPWRVVDGTVRKSTGLTHYLLGLMHGHYDVATDNHDNTEDAENTEKMNTGIGIVVPVQDILETINQPDLAEKRSRFAAALPEQKGQ